MKNIRLGDVLIGSGYITDDQLKQALEYQKTDRSKRVGEILIELGYVSEKQMLEALGKGMNLSCVNISEQVIDIEAVEKIPKAIAQKYNMLAQKLEGNILTVITNDPLNFYGMEDVRQITGKTLQIILTELEPLKKAIDYYYSEVSARNAAKTANQSSAVVEEIEVEDGDGDAPIIKLLNSLVLRGYSTNASDIHIEPFDDKTYVRMRIDGVIMDYVTLQKALHPSLIARIKIMANLDIAEKRIPQDGHFRTKLEGEDVNVRVSILPTSFGEKAVLRLLSNNVTIDRAGNYGMNEENFKKFNKMLKSPNGIIYITGPTGSGKTTTLYMVIEQYSKKLVNISTIEDPVEKNLQRINQTQVNNQAGLTFEMGLRALLRQDPDVIMVGETRDAETASISVRAAITGHLVFSTLHTNDAISSIVRLVDMGLEKYMIANSLVGVVAQRLMRKVCDNCAYETDATEEEKMLLGDDVEKTTHGKGCSMCNHTGYKGRTAIHEVINIDKNVRNLITQGASMDDIEDYMRKNQNFKSLKETAIELVRSGVTTCEELLKVAYYS